MNWGTATITRKQPWRYEKNQILERTLGSRSCLTKCFLAMKCLASDGYEKTVRIRRILPAVAPVPLFSPKDASSIRIFAVSDLHTDYSENLAWVRHMPMDVFGQDALIVAGDVAENLDTFEITMALLKERFKHVFFVPGNHDLWCRGNIAKSMHSLEKLKRLLDICCALGVEMKPTMVKGVGIVPLFSWYHQANVCSFCCSQAAALKKQFYLSFTSHFSLLQSFDKEPDLSGYRFPPLKFVCRDFQACRWLDPYTNSGDTLAVFFDTLNTDFWDAVEELKQNACQIISFSHFLPRLELCPEKRMLYYPNLPKVVGSDYLEARVRKLHGTDGNSSACHVFGHTHFCWDATLDGIRYIQAPLAYPNERQRRINGGADWLPFCIYNSDSGGMVEGPLPFYWSDYYRQNTRDPSNTQLAPWVRQFYTATSSKG